MRAASDVDPSPPEMAQARARVVVAAVAAGGVCVARCPVCSVVAGVVAGRFAVVVVARASSFFAGRVLAAGVGRAFVSAGAGGAARCVLVATRPCSAGADGRLVTVALTAALSLTTGTTCGC